MTRLLLLSLALAFPSSALAQAASPAPQNRATSDISGRPVPVAAAHTRAKAARRHYSRPSVLRRVAGANAIATHDPASRDFVNAIQVYPYAEGSLYSLYAAPERVTDIALQPGESLVSVAAGDTARWIIGDTTSGSGETKRTHVLVKPFSAGLATNLVITTDRRSYHLTLASTHGPAMAALSWRYPQAELIAVRRATVSAEQAAPVAAGLPLDQLHFDYEITGDEPPWRPLRAFDDGRQTFIEFPASIAVGEAPPLFVVDADGKALLVNYRVQGRFYVVDRIFDVAELRLGTKKQQIVRIARRGEQRHRRGS